MDERQHRLLWQERRERLRAFLRCACWIRLEVGDCESRSSDPLTPFESGSKYRMVEVDHAVREDLARPCGRANKPPTLFSP